MARTDPRSARGNARPTPDFTDPRDNPQRRPAPAEGGTPPREADPRTGGTPFPTARGPGTPGPVSTPETVLGKETPPEARNAETVAEQERRAERAGATEPPAVDPRRDAAGGLRGGASRDDALRILGFIALGVLVVIFLIWAL